MRLRDIPKHWCAFCWAMISLLVVFWVMCVTVMIIGFVSANMAGAALAGLYAAIAGSMIVWCGYAEANRHYEVGE